MADPGFEINGVTYPIPSIDTFDMDEAMVFYEYSKMSLENLLDLDTLPPTVIAGLAHIAISRSDPSLKHQQVKAIVSSQNALELWANMLTAAAAAGDDGEGDAVPPPSDSSSDSNGNASGVSSETTSAPPPASTGQPGTGLLSLEGVPV